MRWIVFIITACVFVELDHSLMHALRWGDSSVRPVMSSALLAFVALTASRSIVPWAALILGLLVDLLEPYSQVPDRMVTLIGPNALAYLAAAYVVMQLRTLVFPRRAMSIGFMAFVAHACSALVLISIFVIRSRFDSVVYPTRDGALAEFFHQILVALYSGLVGVPVGWMLLKTLPVWGFQVSMTRMAIRR
ncbi:MAG TPA: hypothetical protein VG711_00795 [Phycisphaerales bacterium]|nr:hypothetical protein [Phycisphaerales bacterium]